MPSPQPVLTLRLLGDGLEFVVDNPGPNVLRIWDRENSWGWPTLELEVEAADGGERIRLTPSPRRWTRNFPVAVEIEPGGSHVFFVPGGAGAAPQWQGVERVRHLVDQSVRIRGSLRIPPSVEAEEHGVFVGSVWSPTYESEPPHGWLPASAA